jgi:hypothetical protein
MEPSLNVPTAVNCCVLPLVIEGFAGVGAMETSVGGVTVNTVEPVIEPLAAEIVEVPAATPVASPPVLIVATPVVPETHVTLPVMFAVLLSVKVPVAVNCWVAAFAIVGFAGVTAMETRAAGVTFSVAVPLMIPDAAVIVEEPTPAPVARPPVVIVANEVTEEVQVTLLVRFCVLLSENVPVAVYCSVVPFGMVLVPGVTAMETSEALTPTPRSG